MAEAQHTAGLELPEFTHLHGAHGETSYTGDLLLCPLVSSNTNGPGLQMGENTKWEREDRDK